MKKYKEEQYEIERKYIVDKYFSSVKFLSTLEKVSDRPVSKCDVLINSIPYILYKYESGLITLIPKIDDLFIGDFDDVYQLECAKNCGLHLSIIRKKHSIIENFNYDFLLNEQGRAADYVQVLSKHCSMEDDDNILYQKYKEKNIPLELFLISYGINELELLKKEKIVEIRKYRNGNCEKSIYNSTDTLFTDVINDRMKFEKIDIDENTSLIKTVQDIIGNKDFQKVKK